MEVAATGVAAHVVEDAPKSFALEVRAIGIGHKVEVHLRLFEEYLLDAELFAADAQGNNADEFFGNVWNGTKSVSKAATIGVEVVVKVLAGSEVVEFAIEQHALGVAGDVEVGEVHLKVGLEGAVIDVIRGRRKEEGDMSAGGLAPDDLPAEGVFSFLFPPSSFLENSGVSFRSSAMAWLRIF